MGNYEKVTKDNIVFQPRKNILKLLQDNLSVSNIDFFNLLPDLTSRGFTGFPFVVLPESNLNPIDDVTLKGNIQYADVLEGAVYQDQEKLGDDKARTILNDFVKTINKRSDKKNLAKYGVRGLTITLEPSDLIPTIIQSKKAVVFDFAISYVMDVEMDA